MEPDRNHAWWRAHLERIEREGITTKAYADREGIAPTSLYYWRKFFRLQDERQRATSGMKSAFVPLRLEPVQTPPVLTAACTLRFDAGFQVEMNTMPSAQWLATLAAKLRTGVR